MTALAHFESNTISQDRLLPGLHGLRGLAALSVVLFHVVHLADIAAPREFSFIARDFGKGVHLFFVLSAYSLLHSTEDTMSRSTWMNEYFVRRFFRIAPLYYLILAGMIMWPVYKSQALSTGLHEVILNVTFTFGFVPWTGVVWAGWTVGVEMLFYAVLPVLMMTVRSRMSTLYLAVISIVVAHAANAVLSVHYAHSVSVYGYNWAYFSFPANLCYFALGMYAFRVARDEAGEAVAVKRGTSILAVALLGSLMLGHQFHLWQGHPALWGIGFAALTLWQGRWPSHWCANRALVRLGERSYSIYLLHPIMIVLLKDPLRLMNDYLTPMLGPYAYFICAAAVLIPLLLLSELTYRYIEIPGIRRGRLINARLRAKAHSEVVIARAHL